MNEADKKVVQEALYSALDIAADAMALVVTGLARSGNARQLADSLREQMAAVDFRENKARHVKAIAQRSLEALDAEAIRQGHPPATH